MIVKKIITKRLILEHFKATDTEELHLLANDKNVSETLQNMPSPYTKKNAMSWINTMNKKMRAGESEFYAIKLQDAGKIIGCVNLGIKKANNNATIGYWLGSKYWGSGYGTEATRALLKRGFDDLDLNKIYATFMTINPASGNIMRKLGMHKEGLFKEHVQKNGKYLHEEQWAILRSDYIIKKHAK